MNSWIEIKVCFDGIPESLKVKLQLLKLLIINDVPNIVESYFDGIASGESPEEVEAAIFTGEDDLPVVVYAESDREAHRICALIQAEFKHVLKPVVRTLDDTELESAWSEEVFFETDRFLICPAGSEQAVKTTRRHVIKVNSGQAFGNGQHVSTLAMLKSLEALALNSGTRVLDLGTGNGVLLIAASMLGVKGLVGTDLSQDILDEAQANFSLNHVTAEIHLTTVVPYQSGLFDLVLVNIPVTGIRPLLTDIMAATTKDARIIMSGFTASDGQAFARELATTGLVLEAQEAVRGWVALRFKKT
jgi:ribosomal protein L11 methylase PrmA